MFSISLANHSCGESPHSSRTESIHPKSIRELSSFTLKVQQDPLKVVCSGNTEDRSGYRLHSCSGSSMEHGGSKSFI